MSELFVFAFGLFATILAVGPLILAGYLDSKDKKNN
jgi:hypothetical protein